MSFKPDNNDSRADYLFDYFDSSIDCYLDIFVNNSLTEENRKEGFRALSDLRCLLTLFLFIKHQANSEAFDEMLEGVIEPLSMMLEVVYETYQRSKDIDFLILRLKSATDHASEKFDIDSKPVRDLLAKQFYSDMKSKARQTITRNKKAKGFGSATNYRGRP